MKLFKMIKLKLGGKFYHELASDMGYHDISMAVDRLYQIESTENTFAWLKSSGYDLRYSNEEFLIELCNLLYISYMPVYFYGLEDLASTDGFYKRLFAYLYHLTSKENVFENNKWTQIPYTTSKDTINAIKMAYIEYIYNTNLNNEDIPIGSSKARKLLHELYDNRYISKEKLIDYFIRFGKIEFGKNNKFTSSHIANDLAKILAKSISEKGLYRKQFFTYMSSENFTFFTEKK